MVMKRLVRFHVIMKIYDVRSPIPSHAFILSKLSQMFKVSTLAAFNLSSPNEIFFRARTANLWIDLVENRAKNIPLLQRHSMPICRKETV